jgi:hypothetical protein
VWAGKGLFARKRLPQFACVGTFWGYDLGWGEASSYAALHEPADVTTGRLWPCVAPLSSLVSLCAALA